MLEGMELESFHHTFEDIFLNLNKTGFLVDNLKEAKPDPILSKTQPDFYEFTSKYPTFAAIRAVAL